MAVDKLSVSLDDAVAVAARQAAKRRGVSLSAWLNEVTLNALAVEEGLAAVAEWEAEHGAFTPAEIAAADAVLHAAGVPRIQ